MALINAVEFTTNTAAVCEDELVPTDDDQYKMSNPYFAQFSDNSLEAYPEILGGIMIRTSSRFPTPTCSTPVVVAIPVIHASLWRLSSAVTACPSMPARCTKEMPPCWMSVRIVTYACKCS